MKQNLPNSNANDILFGDPSGGQSQQNNEGMQSKAPPDPAKLEKEKADILSHFKRKSASQQGNLFMQQMGPGGMMTPQQMALMNQQMAMMQAQAQQGAMNPMQIQAMQMQMMQQRQQQQQMGNLYFYFYFCFFTFFLCV